MARVTVCVSTRLNESYHWTRWYFGRKRARGSSCHCPLGRLLKITHTLLFFFFYFYVCTCNTHVIIFYIFSRQDNKQSREQRILNRIVALIYGGYRESRLPDCTRCVQRRHDLYPHHFRTLRYKLSSVYARHSVIFGLQRKTDRLASVPFSPERSIVSHLSLWIQ